MTSDSDEKPVSVCFFFSSAMHIIRRRDALRSPNMIRSSIHSENKTPFLSCLLSSSRFLPSSASTSFSSSSYSSSSSSCRIPPSLRLELPILAVNSKPQLADKQMNRCSTGRPRLICKNYAAIHCFSRFF